MLYVSGGDIVNSLCLPIGPEPEEEYPWDDLIAEVLGGWRDECGMSEEQENVLVDLLIGFRELSDGVQNRGTYEDYTYLLGVVISNAEPTDDVQGELGVVAAWLHDVLDEDAFKEYVDAAVQTTEPWDSDVELGEGELVSEDEGKVGVDASTQTDE
ncbi:hypothetical protein K466DRAFT_602236 [Polyporus arcularius HHB13444]|uniref:Uncharacterized protein n=1 Tax=Polyporus arcularius HHB13444 TaxID=1314778 RepID=A0A5C3P6E0_9APHY|nr:hypothetical protein K466DRAFT_602236 [Polyporus arcularius HHB13444]